MRISVNLSVKGARYYKAAEMLKKGSLSSGLAIRLEHQPDNPHDKNAVAVRVKKTDAMLGHISKELAPKYAALIGSGCIIEAVIANVAKDGPYINIDIQVIYDQSEAQLLEKRSSRLWQTASVLPAEPGIYSIQHVDSGRQYIGSSNNIKNRLYSHIRDLSIGSHANHNLQSDFSVFGANRFEARVLLMDVLPSDLTKAEADCIFSLLNERKELYNLTEDGQGAGRKSYVKSNSEPISDRRARQRVDAERIKAKKIFTDKRKNIIAVFEPKLTALLPKVSFWSYFVGTFLCAIILLIIFIPNINDGSLFTLSALSAFVVSPFINGYFRQKARQTEQYQNLIRQRDEQLAVLENERNKGETNEIMFNR